MPSAATHTGPPWKARTWVRTLSRIRALALALGVLVVPLSACEGQPSTVRAPAPPLRLPRVNLESGFSRYGELKIVDVVAGRPRARVVLDGRTVFTAGAGELKLADAAAVGDSDVFVLVLHDSKASCDRAMFLQIEPGSRARITDPAGRCVSAPKTALTQYGLTIQVADLTGPVLGHRCYDWNGAASGRSCAPLTRADERRAMPTARYISMGCRDPSFKVTAVSKPDTPHASLVLEYPPEAARAHCEYLESYEGGGWTPSARQACIKRELADTPGPLTAHADCVKRSITDVEGGQYRYEGRAYSRSIGTEFAEWQDSWRNTETGDRMFVPACANRYRPMVDQFIAMCPRMSGFLMIDERHSFHVE
jgi:hypothetical protein